MDLGRGFFSFLQLLRGLDCSSFGSNAPLFLGEAGVWPMPSQILSAWSPDPPSGGDTLFLLRIRPQTLFFHFGCTGEAFKAGIGSDLSLLRLLYFRSVSELSSGSPVPPFICASGGARVFATLIKWLALFLLLFFKFFESPFSPDSHCFIRHPNFDLLSFWEWIIPLRAFLFLLPPSLSRM